MEHLRGTPREGSRPEQPSDDGSEKLARGAAAVVEGSWHGVGGTNPLVGNAPDLRVATG